MTNLDYSAESKRLDDLERITLPHDATQRKVAVAAARYQLDQAVSLAILADSIEALVTHVVGQVPAEEQAKADDEDDLTRARRAALSATEAAVGDLVAVRTEEVSSVDDVKPRRVAELGASECETWLKLDDATGKVWAKSYVIVDRSGSTVDDADDELATRIEADRKQFTERMEAAIERDEVDDDFEAPTDGLAALKAGKKAKKKGGTQ